MTLAEPPLELRLCLLADSLWVSYPRESQGFGLGRVLCVVLFFSSFPPFLFFSCCLKQIPNKLTIFFFGKQQKCIKTRLEIQDVPDPKTSTKQYT